MGIMSRNNIRPTCSTTPLKSLVNEDIMKGCWSVVSFSIHEGFIIIPCEKIPLPFHQIFTPRVIAQYLQILAIDGFLSFGSLVSVWAYMWLMLESTLGLRVKKTRKKTYRTEKTSIADKRSILSKVWGGGGLYVVISLRPQNHETWRF